MERAGAVARLPTVHAVAIRLRDVGADDCLIATALAIDDDQVPVLLSIAEAKLASLLWEGTGSARDGSPGGA
jgi:hypothetical protein